MQSSNSVNDKNNIQFVDRSKVIGEIQLKPKVRAAQVIGNSIYSFPVYTFTTDDIVSFSSLCFSD